MDRAVPTSSLESARQPSTKSGGNVREHCRLMGKGWRSHQSRQMQSFCRDSKRERDQISWGVAELHLLFLYWLSCQVQSKQDRIYGPFIRKPYLKLLAIIPIQLKFRKKIMTFEYWIICIYLDELVSGSEVPRHGGLWRSVRQGIEALRLPSRPRDASRPGQRDLFLLQTR